MRFQSANLACRFLAIIVMGAVLPGTARATDAPIEDWTRIVPGDVRFYVELRGLAAVRVQFRSLGIWDTVVELREQDARRKDGGRWQQRTEELLGLDAESAVSELLGGRSALLATGPDEWDNGVLLAELAGEDALKKLLKRWSARELTEPGVVRKYSLSGGLQLGVFGQTLILGPAGDPDGLWLRTIQLISGELGPNLAGRADFAALRARLGPDPQGILFSAWNRSDPNAIAGCRRLLVGGWIKPTEIVCELRGQLADARGADEPIDLTLIEHVPVTTLAAWAGNMDLAAAASPPDGDPGQSLAAIFTSAFGTLSGGSGPLIKAMGPQYSVIVARDPPALVTGFDLPAITAVCDSTEGETIVANLDGLIDILGKGLALVTARAGEQPEDVSVKTSRCEDAELHSIAIGRPLARRLGLDFLRRTELCWGLIEGRIIISTSRAHVEEVVRALRGKAPRLGGMIEEMIPTSGDQRVSEFFLLRGSAVSAMLTNWLAYIDKNHPEAMKSEWWQAWARGQLDERQRLGVALEADAGSPRAALVVDVNEFSPAFEYLMPGDRIVAVAGSPLGADRPAHEVAERYRQRGRVDSFEMEIVRDGEKRLVSIPVKPVPSMDVRDLDPARAIEQLATLTRRAETVTICRYLGKRAHLDAKIVIRWGSERRRAGPSQAESK